jgi:hypothetical protein
MDLFIKSIQTIDYDHHLLRELPGKEGTNNYFIKLALYGENERVILLELKDFQGVSEQYYKNIFTNLMMAGRNFLKLKFVVHKKQTERMFFCYEDADITLKDYLDKNTCDFVTRLYFFKRVLEIIFDLKARYSSFDFFDPNLLFVICNTSKRPLLKTIYHGNIVI